MSGLQFKISLKPGEPGVLWGFWRIHSLKATGVLTVEWERFKKQIVFKSGQPVASRSNWPHETFTNFLIRQKMVDAAGMQKLNQELQQLNPAPPLGEYLVQKSLLDAFQLSELIEKHFRERIFNLVALSHGDVSFETYDQLNLKDTDQTKLTGEFLRLLWDAARLHLDEAICRSRLVAVAGRPVRLRGDCPFPISPKELRHWNEMSREFKNIQSLELDALRLLAVGTEFHVLELGESPVDKLMKEMRDMDKKFKGAKAHEILHVDEDSSVEICKKSYLEMVKKYHPDRLPSDASQELKKMSENIFAKINEAYTTLTDSEKRAEYQAKQEIEKSGGMAAIEKTLEAEMLIPQAKMALKRRHFKNAHELLAKITDVLPKDGEILADFAFAKIMQLVEAKIPYKERLREFMEEIEKSLKMRPQYGAGYYYLGVLLKLDGQTEKAIQYFDQALQYDSSLQEAASEVRVLRMRKGSDSKKSLGFFGKKK